MNLNDILLRVQTMSNADCIKLNEALRERRQVLANAPDPILAVKVRSSKTASVMIKDRLYTGSIEDRTSRCLVLRFADDRRMFLPIASLSTHGFDLPLTNAPDIPSPKMQDSKTPIQIQNLALCKGYLYLISQRSDTMAEGQRLIPMSEIENFSLSDLQFVSQGKPQLVEL